MPGGDRSGPLGMGPRTGRAAGFCAGYGMPGYSNPRPGRGMGRGRGGGWGGRRAGGRGGGWGAGWQVGFGPESGPGPDRTGDTGDALRDEIEELHARVAALEKHNGVGDGKE